MRRFIPFVFVLMAVVAGPVAEATAKTAVNAARWTGIAIEGTDPVAYFTEGKPVEGSREFIHEWDGAKWRFASAKNRDLFKANPEKYAPQFGGWCAYAVSQGYTASIEPEAWSIVDGKLYLNYSVSVRKQWQAEIPGHIQKGTKNWPRISKSLLE
jgi:YHS domain-containing protein